MELALALPAPALATGAAAVSPPPALALAPRRITGPQNDNNIVADLVTQEVREYSQFSTYDKSYSVREWPMIYREPVKEELTHFLKAVRDKTPGFTRD